MNEKYCESCGELLEENSDYCHKCGGMSRNFKEKIEETNRRNEAEQLRKNKERYWISPEKNIKLGIVSVYF